MLIVVSPAKNLDVSTLSPQRAHTLPELLEDSERLAQECKALTPADLSSLMSISDKLAVLNAERFNSFTTPFTTDNAKQAMYMFNGDVYVGLDVNSLTDDDVAFAQEHLRILSGLYGVLRPLDLIQPYRLEMGTKLSTAQGKNLYEFWSSKISQTLNKHADSTEEPVLINLASNEYFKAVDKKALDARIITPIFKDCKNGQYKVISFFAKKARGLMARYIIQNRLTSPAQLNQFDLGGYYYSAAHSSESEPVFLREENV